MSNLSELLPAGAGAKSAEFVASGTLASGQTVILNSDGTVEAVAETAIPQAVGTPVTFESASTLVISATYDSTAQKIVIAYRDGGNSNYSTAVVGTVSGTSISFGTPVVFNTNSPAYISTTFDSVSNKVVIAFQGASAYGTAIVGTVSGTSISFGTSVVFSSNVSTYFAATYDVSNGKVVIAYVASGNTTGYGTAIVGTVSGTSISFGSAVTFSATNSDQEAIAYDSASGKVVIAYANRGNSTYGTAIVGTVSGTSISFGFPTVFNSAVSVGNSAAFDTNSNKVVIFYEDYGNSAYGTAIVGTVSGTSISFGTPVVFNANSVGSISTTFDSNSNKTVTSFADYSNSGYGTAIVGTVSGTSISFGAKITLESAEISYIGTTFDSTLNRVVTAYRKNNTTYGTSVVLRNASTASNNTDFIGITDQAIADTATGAVIVQGGVSDKVTGLTTGSDYYVQSNGTLSTTVSSVPAGRALSSTSILLEG